MKNSFSRFVFVALLSTVAGIVFAGRNWNAPIPGGANQVSVNTGSGQVVDAKENTKNAVGNRIGRNTGGETVLSGNQGKVAFTQDANGTIRLPDGTVHSGNDKRSSQAASGLKTDKAQQQTYCVPSEGKYPFECHNETVPDHSFSTLKEAEEFVVNDWKGQYAECGQSTESHALLVEKDGKYFKAGESWYQTKEDPIMGSRQGISSAPGSNPEYIEKLEKEGYRVIETMHNHYKRNGIYEGLYEWPTLSDVVSAISQGAPSVVFNCLDNLYRIDNETGMVYRRNIQSSEWNAVSFEEWGKNDPDWQKTTNVDKQLFDGEFDEKDVKMKDKLKVLYDGKNPTFAQLKNWWKNVNASVNSEGAPVSEVGIRGWCKCKEKRETSGARGDMVGIAGTIFGIGIGGDESAPMARYLYTFCRYCGKCRQPELDHPDHLYTPNIWDNQLEMQLAVTNGLRTCDYVNARKAVERKFMKIPDGQIVFPGKCTCKRPDPIQDGFHTTCVCVKCGRYYESE